MAYQIFKFSTTSVSEQIADFAVKLDVNGGDTLEESVLIPNAEGKLSRPSYPHPQQPHV